MPRASRLLPHTVRLTAEEEDPAVPVPGVGGSNHLHLGRQPLPEVEPGGAAAMPQLSWRAGDARTRGLIWGTSVGRKKAWVMGVR